MFEKVADTARAKHSLIGSNLPLYIFWYSDFVPWSSQGNTGSYSLSRAVITLWTFICRLQRVSFYSRLTDIIILIVIHIDNQGKEFETRLKEKKPGDLSDDLRTALGMPIGANNHLVPPPWLIAMQRYGPPPSYPNLKIPGLNAPIPEVRTGSFP